MKKLQLKKPVSYTILTYDCKIYPRKLWVAIGEPQYKTAYERFTFRTGEPLNFKIKTLNGFAALVERKSDRKLGSLIFISQDAISNNSVIVHEIFHATLDILSEVGVVLDSENQEPIAYLGGYITNCVFDAILKYKRR